MKPETKDTKWRWYQFRCHGSLSGFILGFLIANRIPESYKQSVLVTAFAVAAFPLCVDCFLAGWHGKLLFGNKRDEKDV